ncbi:MAG: tRNA (adenosine(37)-N6)-dimethylallyltransferase MiaA [Planctomycetaceae bacterium]
MENPASSESMVYPPLSEEAIILTGPTAGGKSAVALWLAEQIDGEIISLDSIAVYRGMDIGTAKPSPADRARVPHHLIDVVPAGEEFSAAHYLSQATKCVADILARGKRPLFVGGTPLYLKGLMHGFDPGPPADWEFRRSVERDIHTYGIEALHDRLRQVDPLSAHRLPPTDTRRITRALEVAYLTGTPLSHRQTQFDARAARTTAQLFALAWPREILHKRIEARVRQMFEDGLVAEVAGLLREHGQLSRTATAAVGYREVIEHLQQGTPLDATIQLVIYHTRQLARRQETWFRSLPTLQRVAVDDEAMLDQIGQQILRSIQQPKRAP